ncbi:Hypothetical protein NGAL_HAMBI490_56170 [Neorhizobium galegae bv. officinalis]|nr:Hypothetical protein NGAL_HAMBI490_56170 [Neorhizobium galegae bv. officinalis]
MAAEDIEYDEIRQWQIRDGWFLDEIMTLDDCEEALDVLEDDIANVRTQLASCDEGLYRQGTRRGPSALEMRYARSAAFSSACALESIL